MDVNERYEKGQVYRCGACGEEFAATCSHADAVAEYEIVADKEFNPADGVVVCDDCFRMIMGLPPSTEPEE